VSGQARIEPGALFASDYRIERVLCAEQPDRCYIATENKGGRRVRIVELPASRSLAWTTAAVEHPALAELLAVLTVLSSNFGVFEEVDGTRASARLAEAGPLGAFEAVRAALRVTEGLTVMHRSGLIHGAVQPGNVVIEPERPGAATLVPGSASQRPPGYRAPDREGQALAPEDDLWATGALLYEMLTGAAPPESGVSAPEQLEDAGLEEDVLGGIVAQALAADPNRRSSRIASMRHPLSCWLERNEKQPESAPGSARSYAWSRAVLPSSRPPPQRNSEAPELEVSEGLLSEPPPDSTALPARRDSHRPEIEVAEGHLSEPPPESDAAAPSVDAPEEAAPANADVTRQAPESSSGKRWFGLAVAAVVVCGVALLVSRHKTGSPAASHRAISRQSARPASIGPRAPSARVRKRPPPPAVSAAAPAPPTASAAPADESVAVCVARHLPAFSFMKTPDMDWLCQVGDPRSGAQHLHGDIVRASNGHSVTPAMQLFSPLTWYGMAELAVLRGACCLDAPPLKLPAPSAGCQSMAEVLNGLATEVSEAANPEPQIQAFSEAIGCEVRHNRQVAFWQKDRPGGGEAHDFEKLLESAMHPRSAP
jgi:hypothetical protein